MEQTLILVDDKDNILGYASRSECHKGKGKRHRAFVILLYNKNKKILLQHRKHKLFDELWDLAAASHPLRIDKKSESYLQAASRCLKEEWGIEGVKLRKIGAFNYFEKYGEQCENEHCALILGRCDKKMKIDPKYAYDLRWVSFRQLLSEIKKSPGNFTPWSKEAIKLFKNHKFGNEFLRE